MWTKEDDILVWLLLGLRLGDDEMTDGSEDSLWKERNFHLLTPFPTQGTPMRLHLPHFGFAWSHFSSQ